MLHSTSLRGPARARLLGGVALAALLAARGGVAAAQTAAPAGSPAPSERNISQPIRAPAPQNVLGEDGFYLEADNLIDDQDAKTWTARGQVEARYQDRTVRANEIIYRTDTGAVFARGDAVLVNADGSAQFADEIELDEDLRAGVAKGFATRLGRNTKLAAATAIRRSESLHELNQAIYTACNVCVKEGQAQDPTWSVRAEKAVQDRDKRVVYYRNATFQVAGVPVLYAPVFWHADPAAERASGFLTPKVQLSDRRGFSYEQPYLWVISPSQDLVVSPMVSTKVNPLLNSTYRKRFYSGRMEVRGGATYEKNFNSRGEKFGEAEPRSYILSDGEFEINDDWIWGFTGERVSDPTFFDRYNIPSVFNHWRGLYAPDSRRLISQLYAVRQSENSYLSVATISFQGLRPGDRNDRFPIVAPLVEGRWEPESDIAGGRLRISGGGVLLDRGEGTDSRRASLEGDWRRAFTMANGVRLEPFAIARADVFSVSRDTAATDDDDVITRGWGALGLDVTWPFIRPFRGGSIVVEPIAQFIASPEVDDQDDIPNEDSSTFDFDATNLFEPNRFPGYDRVESGLRLNAGGRVTASWDGFRRASLLVGRSFRAEPDESFAPNTGLRGRASDWIVQTSSTPLRGLTLWSRARLDGEDFSIRRAESAVNWNLGRTAGYARYLRDEVRDRQEFDTAGEFMVTRRWGVLFHGIRDIDDGVWRRGEIGALYRDECTRLAIVYQRNETFNRQLGPSENILFRLTLATLGGIAYTDYEDR